MTPVEIVALDALLRWHVEVGGADAPRLPKFAADLLEAAAALQEERATKKRRDTISALKFGEIVRDIKHGRRAKVIVADHDTCRILVLPGYVRTPEQWNYADIELPESPHA